MVDMDMQLTRFTILRMRADSGYAIPCESMQEGGKGMQYRDGAKRRATGSIPGASTTTCANRLDFQKQTVAVDTGLTLPITGSARR